MLVLGSGGLSKVCVPEQVNKGADLGLGVLVLHQSWNLGDLGMEAFAF